MVLFLCLRLPLYAFQPRLRSTQPRRAGSSVIIRRARILQSHEKKNSGEPGEGEVFFFPFLFEGKSGGEGRDAFLCFGRDGVGCG